MTNETNFAVTWTAKDGAENVSHFCATTAAVAEANALRTLRRRPEFGAIVKVEAPVAEKAAREAKSVQPVEAAPTYSLIVHKPGKVVRLGDEVVLVGKEDFVARTGVGFMEATTWARRSKYRSIREERPEPKPVVVRMARYEAAYKACHGRTAIVTWSGEKVRVHTPGQNPDYDAYFSPDQLDEISERMEAKVAEAAARRDAPAPMDVFEALGLPRSSDEAEGR